jgi:hypothetical protein
MSNVIEGRENKDAPFPEEKVGELGVKEACNKLLGKDRRQRDHQQRASAGDKVVGEKFETGNTFCRIY